MRAVSVFETGAPRIVLQMSVRFGLMKIRVIRLKMSCYLIDRLVCSLAGGLAKFKIGI